MKAKSLISVLFLLLLFTVNGRAQQLNVAKLDSLFLQLESNDKYMGSIAISQNGQLIYTRTVGYADIELSTKSTTKTKYRIGSISKMFTSAMILKAVEEKKITLDKTIDGYFPSVENAQKITIGNLLNHRSGIHSFTDDSDYLQWCTQPISEKELIDKIVKGRSEFEPGSKAKYSNSNYVLLTFILEKIYKKPYRELILSKIAKPLKLKDTYLGADTDISDNECYSYRFKDKWVKENVTDMSVPLGAGAVISNPSDLTRFIEGLFAGKIISENSLKHMTTMQENFGMGMFSYNFFNKNFYGHTGGIDGFVSMLIYMPEEKLSVAITSNGVNYSVNNIMLGALSCYYDKPYEIPSFKTLELKPEELEQYIGVYASPQLPLKITFTKDGNKLVAQGSGQPSFGLSATGKHLFVGANGTIIIEFKPEASQMTLKQGGATFTFTKE